MIKPIISEANNTFFKNIIPHSSGQNKPYSNYLGPLEEPPLEDEPEELLLLELERDGDE